MKCSKCGKELNAENALVCKDCGRNYCEVCATLSEKCECDGDFSCYN